MIMKDMDQVLSENAIRRTLKLSMLPVPAIFKMAIKTAIVKIKRAEQHEIQGEGK